MTLGDRARSRMATPLVLDLAERSALVALYAWLVSRLAGSMSEGRAINGLLIVSEGLVIVFLLARRTTSEVSRNPADWLLAILATCGPLLVSPSRGRPIAPAGVAASLWLLGTILQVSAKVALGRSFGCVPANRGLRCQGPYRLVRHPMYAGYLLTHLAFLLMNPTIGNVAIYVLCDSIQVPRMLIEERLLGRDSAYRAYCSTVRWRVVPGVF